MGIVSVSANVAYVLLLVGGLNWLVTGVRLTIDETGDNLITEPLPDLLSWGGELFQIVIYLSVGAASLLLLLLTTMGFWLRKGDGCVLCV